jgi:hypothetical protein
VSDKFKCDYCFDDHDRLYICHDKERAYFVTEKKRLELAVNTQTDLYRGALVKLDRLEKVRVAAEALTAFADHKPNCHIRKETGSYCDCNLPVFLNKWRKAAGR